MDLLQAGVGCGHINLGHLTSIVVEGPAGFVGRGVAGPTTRVESDPKRTLSLAAASPGPP